MAKKYGIKANMKSVAIVEALLQIPELQKNVSGSSENVDPALNNKAIMSPKRRKQQQQRKLKESTNVLRSIPKKKNKSPHDISSSSPTSAAIQAEESFKQNKLKNLHKFVSAEAVAKGESKNREQLAAKIKQQMEEQRKLMQQLEEVRSQKRREEEQFQNQASEFQQQFDRRRKSQLHPVLAENYEAIHKALSPSIFKMEKENVVPGTSVVVGRFSSASATKRRKLSNMSTATSS